MQRSVRLTDKYTEIRMRGIQKMFFKILISLPIFFFFFIQGQTKQNFCKYNLKHLKVYEVLIYHFLGLKKDLFNHGKSMLHQA